ncbi:hypothetical protein B566_EDAN017227 [Ephemera danica]|nr:hypothetical protein B566_EDAN017227 [Ephemera danica]
MTFGRFALALVCLMTVTIILTSARGLPPKRPATFWHVNFTRPDFRLGPIVANWRAGISKVNPDEMGSYFQGDIMLPEKPPTMTRNGVDYAVYQWTEGIVPYVIDSTIGSTQLAIINQAISAIQAQTCVKFVPRTTQTDYVKVQNQNSGCWSYVGRKGGMQELNLQTNGCHIVPNAPIGQRTAMTTGDITRIKGMYNCPA